MSRTGILESIYTRVSVMTTSNGFNFDWTDMRSVANGANVLGGTFLYAEYGAESNINGGVIQNGSYNLEIPVVLKGYSRKAGSSSLDRVEQDIEIQKSKMVDDIRSAFAFKWNEFCAASGHYFEYTGELEPPATSNEDSFEVEANCGFVARFTATVYNG